jgi:cephamycin C biosynthesis protein
VAVDHLFEQGDYSIIEDMIPTWRRYSPGLLSECLAAFRQVLTMDVLYSNACPQLGGGVFRPL